MTTPKLALLLYVDPGSGAMMWQVLAAALFGSLFRVKRITTWVRSRFKRNRLAE